MFKFRLRDVLLPIIVVTVGAQVLFNLVFSLLGLPYAIENHFIPEFLLVFAGYLVVAAVLWLMLRYSVKSTIYKTTLLATALSLPLMGVLISVGILLYGFDDWIILAVCATLSIIVYSLFYIKKASWIYWFTMLYVDILALIVVLFDIQI